MLIGHTMRRAPRSVDRMAPGADEVAGTSTDLVGERHHPRIAHFCGHRIGDRRFPAEAEAQVARAIAAAVDASPAAHAYGALASGADILWAEALHAHGAHLHVVLPLAVEPFVATSVAPAGPSWVTRFHALMAAASSVRCPAPETTAGGLAYRYGSELGMGLALLHARCLDRDALQFAVWDGGPARGEAGTAIDIATWRRTGAPTTVVPVGLDRERPAAQPAAGPRPVPARATLQADLGGHASPGDTGAVEAVLAGFRAVILHRSAGRERIGLVLRDAPSAAACALAMAHAAAAPRLRIVGDVVPLLAPHDALDDGSAPIASPRGGVYVTEAFGAALALGREPFRCDPVAPSPALPGDRQRRMYRLRTPAW